MIDLDERNRGVVVGPRRRFVIQEVVNVAWKSGGWEVRGDNVRGRGDTGGQDLVSWKRRPHEAALSIGLSRTWVVNRYLRASCGRQAGEIPGHECRRGYGDNASPSSHAGEEEAQARKEESLVAAIVDMWNHHRTAQGEPAFVLPVRRPFRQKERPRVQFVVSKMVEDASMQRVRPRLDDDVGEPVAKAAVFCIEGACHHRDLTNLFDKRAILR